jgi:uncharacterized protein (DUF2252 family)
MRKQNPKAAGVIADKLISVAERKSKGKLLREKVPRKDHRLWSAARKGRDPIAIIQQSNAGRVTELLPIRYGRMLKSPFTFFRGSASLMAYDLQSTAASGISVQACGDCHLLNFGVFATPERNLILDINDFDETHPAPWEWDLKRLATSFVLACRGNGFKPAVAKQAAETVVRSYREAMHDISQMKTLDVWYLKMDISTYLAGIKDKQFRKDADAYVAKQTQKSAVDHYVPKLTTQKDGRPVFKDAPPLIYHTPEQCDKEFLSTIKTVFLAFRETLSEDRRVLLDRYALMDVAMKIVGIGSVGTRCGIMLLLAGENDPLVLQVKEARPSVLEPYTQKSAYKHNGHRVVAGQRLMQSQSDIFLGWAVGLHGHHFYVRQLRDMKMSPVPEIWTPERAMEVARSFGWVLARAHARSGDSAIIVGYMGTGTAMDEAIGQFAIAYADQTEQDHRELLKAVKSGRLEAYIER